MGTHYRYTVKEGYSCACSEYLKSRYLYSSRILTYIKKYGKLLINQEPAYFNAIVNEGDVIQICFPGENDTTKAEEGPVDVIYEDRDLLVIDKRPGVVVHPTEGVPDGTLANFIAGYWQSKGTCSRVRFVNRIDRDTSGIVVIAKNKYAHNYVQKSYQSGDIAGEKLYAALLEGTLPTPKGIVDAPIGRPDPESIKREVEVGAKESRTDFEAVSSSSGHTLAVLRLLSGRTHQIRVHMSYIGCPVLGDELYGHKSETEGGRLALHCFSMALRHPRCHDPMRFFAPLPEDICKEARRLGIVVPDALLNREDFDRVFFPRHESL